MLTFKKELLCVFSKDEIIKLSGELCDKFGELRSTEEEKKKSNSDFNEKIKKAETIIDNLVTKIRNRGEEREIECKKEIDFEKGIKTIIRLDTNETVSREKLSDEDRQLELSLIEKGLYDLKKGDKVIDEKGNIFIFFEYAEESENKKASVIENDGFDTEISIEDLTLIAKKTIEDLGIKKGDAVKISNEDHKGTIFIFEEVKELEVQGLGILQEQDSKDEFDEKVAIIRDTEGYECEVFLEEITPIKESILESEDITEKAE